MTVIPRYTALVVLTAIVACGEGEGTRGDGDASGTDAADTSSGSVSASSTMTATSATATTLTTDPTTDTTETESADTTGGGGPFVFEDFDPSEYSQVDRMGMPVVATALITEKDDYNHASPEDDAAEVFLPEIVMNLTDLHGALDDDLIAIDLTPCGIDACVTQLRPLLIPDVIRVDFGADNGFPNGRLPTDPVVDISLAVLLLDLAVHDVTTLADLPLNPTAAEAEPPAEFPYFAEPH